MPEWYRRAFANRDDPLACLAFAKDFLNAPRHERAEVVKMWDPQTQWALPNPWRLACQDEAPGSSAERIRTGLLFEALYLPYLAAIDIRDVLVGLGIVFNSCKLAGIDPGPMFEDIGQAVGGEAQRELRKFITRDTEAKSMEAFGLAAIPNPGGGYEVRLDW
jgi:hypothetical protein